MDTQQKDDMLWKLAKRRASFKYSLAVYIVINTVLIITWFFTSRDNYYFWPAWSVFGWGIGILFQYLNAYHGGSIYSAESEYEKLKRENV
jgi:hypothetical protein